MLLLELNRVLRPGGYFIWSATPVYGKLDEDKEIWKGMNDNKQINLMNKFDDSSIIADTHIYIYIRPCFNAYVEMSALTKSMCWELVAIKNNKVNLVAAAIYRKPTSNQCYEQRKQKQPPMCKTDDDPNAAW